MSERPLVFGLGLPRTGTSSLRAAMAELGWRAQTDPFEERRLQLLFEGRITEAVGRDLAAGYTYLSEPYFAFADQVREAYPSAVMIYTVRDFVSWRTSLKAFLSDRPRRSMPYFVASRDAFTPAQRVLIALAWGRWLPWLTPTAAWWRSMADAPHARSIDVCKGEGWLDLIDALGPAAPARIDVHLSRFPHHNATPTRRALED